MASVAFVIAKAGLRSNLRSLAMLPATILSMTAAQVRVSTPTMVKVCKTSAQVDVTAVSQMDATHRES